MVLAIRQQAEFSGMVEVKEGTVECSKDLQVRQAGEIGTGTPCARHVAAASAAHRVMASRSDTPSWCLVCVCCAGG